MATSSISPRTFGECAGNAFVINDCVAEDDAPEKCGMKVRFVEASGKAFSQLS